MAAGIKDGVIFYCRSREKPREGRFKLRNGLFSRGANSLFEIVYEFTFIQVTRLMAAAMQAAPKPLSMLTTASPGEQLLSIPSRAE